MGGASSGAAPAIVAGPAMWPCGMTACVAGRNRSTRLPLALSSMVLALSGFAGATQAAQVVIAGPSGSGSFGSRVATLPNGNIVVTDPGFDAPGPIVDVGAVFLYRPDGSLISSVRGNNPDDRVGSDGILVLPSGNYLVFSPYWDNGLATNAGAVIFGSATSGVSGIVSAANALVGSTAGDLVGLSRATALPNGNYLVGTQEWDSGAIANVGAVTFGSGTTGIVGTISAANSLIGASPGDRVSRVEVLSNGNYVVVSPSWDSNGIVDAGAVTFGTASGGVTGIVSATNSLVGGNANSEIGSSGVLRLTNGNYVVLSPLWNNGAATDAGAATFGSGVTGITGVVSAANSLVGTRAMDSVGSSGTPLSNGNYVVVSSRWSTASAAEVGAVTFGSGLTGITGPVSASNSLVGSSSSDGVGGYGITALTNGNYVVNSPLWDNASAVNAGAITFGSGTTGVSGTVSASNSLIGGGSNNFVGVRTIALTSGNFVVASPGWDNGATLNVGAATFGSGTSGIVGVVSPANSLVGTTAEDAIGSAGSLDVRVDALANGNYVVRSLTWDNGSTVNAGAVTVGSGTTGITGAVGPGNSLVGDSPNDVIGGYFVPLAGGSFVTGSPNWDSGAAVNVGALIRRAGTPGSSAVVSPANALIGSTANDRIGGEGIRVLANGAVVISSPDWDNGGIVDAGAITFRSASAGFAGQVSPSNSLVGSTAGDALGNLFITPLENGNYVSTDNSWDNGGIVNAGAVTLGLADGSVVGTITSAHSVLSQVGNFPIQTWSYDPERNQLAVGQRASNRVVLHRTGIATTIGNVVDTPDPSVPGQPVTVSATISAVPSAPTDGRMRFAAASGESCVDDTPTPTSAFTANYSCALVFAAGGVTTITAEYIGSTAHAFSAAAPVTHTSTANTVFSNGFEAP